MNRFKNKLGTLLLIGAFSIFSPLLSNAATVNVSTVAALQTAINSAAAGDIIVLADGTYNNSTLNIGTSNITVKSATPGGAYLNGTNTINITGNYVTFSGFQFTSGTITGNVITVDGNYVVLTQLNFKGYSAQKYMNMKGQYDEISFCNFENKPATAAAGNLVHIYTRADGQPNYLKIRYCSFQNMPGAGGDNGNECIRITNASPSTYKARTIIEYCYFTNTGPGDSEVISVKSEENVIRYNTMVNNLGGNFCFRYGDNNVAYGNFFINSGGIRIKQSNNIYCYNNYFENCGDANYSAPVKYVYYAGCLNNLNFVHNTFVGGTPIEFDASSTGTGSTWANNIFKNSTGNIFTGPTTGNSFAGNIYSGTLGVTIPSGMTSIDPQLALNSDGYYGLTATSPAITATAATYPAILDVPNIDDDPTLVFDISGQTRATTASQKDLGCDEYSTAGTTIHPLKLSEVGPSYLGGPGGVVKQDQTITFGALPVKTVGDADFAPGATASSGLTVSYSSSNTAVATIVSGNIHIVGAGTTVITASQAGNATYNAATSVNQTLTVNAPVSYTYAPTYSTITSGSVASGTYSSLATNNAAYYVLNSTTSSTRVCDWYCGTVISQTPSTISKLTITFDGKYSKSRTQVLYLYNWTTLSWVQIDSRTVSTSDVTATVVATTPTNYVSSTGEIRLRAYTSGGTSNYTSSIDYVQFAVEATTLKSAFSNDVEEVVAPTPSVKVFQTNASSTLNIDYNLVETSPVTIDIYDVRGQLVATLVNHQTTDKGSYTETFNVATLNSGLYIVKIELGATTVSKKFLVKR